MTRTRFVQLQNGHRVHVVVAGHGIPVVLLHGYTANALVYRQVIGRLASQGYRVIAMDIPGHGRTAGLTAGRYDFEQYVEVVTETLELLGVMRAIFVGHSMGGRVALRVISRHPEMALGFVPINAAIGAEYDAYMAECAANPLKLAKFLAILGVDCASIGLQHHQRLRFAALAAELLAGNAVHLPRKFAPGLALLHSQPTEPQLAGLKAAGVPTRVLHGRDDRAVKLQFGYDAARLAGGDLVDVQGGHSWFLARPSALPALITNGSMVDRIERAIRQQHGRSSVTPLEAERVFVDPGTGVVELFPGRNARRIWAISAQMPSSAS